MNITWVSDQHLYLVLPAILLFWMKLIDLIKWKYAYLVPGFFVLFFAYKTSEIMPAYKNEISFYESCLEYNPFNVPIVFNLATAKMINGDIQGSYNLLNDTYYLTQEQPLMTKSNYYKHVMTLYYKLKLHIHQNEN
jgi:hypothetical protein